HYKIDMTVPVSELPEEHIQILLHGSGNDKIRFRYENDYGQIRDNHIHFEGVMTNVDRRFRETSSDWTREQMEKYMGEQPGPACKGHRLKPESLAVKVNDLHIGLVSEFSIVEADEFFENLVLSEKDAQIASAIVREIRERVSFLINVGLDCLTLNRA